MDMTIGEFIAFLFEPSVSRLFDFIILIIGFFTGKMVNFSIFSMKGSARNESDNIQSNNKNLNFGGFSIFSFHKHVLPSKKSKNPPKKKDKTK